MAKVSSVCLARSLCVIGTMFLTHVSCETFGLGFNGLQFPGELRSPCDKECVCYNNSSPNLVQENVGFTVNCTGMKYGLNEGLKIPKPLPYNTTELIVTEYLLSTLSLESFNHNSFVWSPRLNRLVLRSCHIYAISTETFISPTLQSLCHIDLNSNNIEELRESTFNPLLQVENISIAHNFITRIEKRTFRNLHKIKIINISYNWLEELDPETFYNLPSLEVLDMSHNRLRTLPWEKFNLPSLEVLDLSHNRLDTLPWDKFSQIPALRILGLRGNYWNCSCQMSNISQINHSLLSGTQARCLHPEQLKGTLLEDLTSDAFSHCFNTQQHFKIRTIIIAMTTLLCIVIAFWYYNNSYYNMSANISSTPSKSYDVCVKQMIMYNIKDALHPAKAVYKGKMIDGQEVAIKIRPWLKVEKELKTLLHLKEKDRLHPNIIQYICAVPVDHLKSTYLALELCCGDLMTAVMEHADWLYDIVVHRDYIFQLASGICYLHKIGIQHRDIKPQNILWKETINGRVLIISDFDLSHLAVEESSHKLRGTTGWAAPELRCLEESRLDGKMDVFSLGCVFYFMLTKGHPFGSLQDQEECQRNINLPEYKASLDAVYEHYNEQCHVGTMAEDLVRKMISYNANERIGHLDLMEHPFVLSESGICIFLIAVGKKLRVGMDPEVRELEEKLEENAETVFDGKWIDKIPDACVRTDLGTCKPEKICSLLKKIRNKIEHVMEIKKPELLDAYSGNEYGVAVYFMTIFPKLVPYVYNIIKSMSFNLH